MREPYVEGSSDPPRPRVMAARSRGRAVSVDRGTRRPAIELRNHPFGTPTSLSDREGDTMRGASASRGIGPAESKTLRMRGSSMHENREIPSAPVGRSRKPSAGRSGKACGHKPDMHAAGKSHIGILPRIVGNKASAPGPAGYDGTVHPPRNRKSGAGNPPSTARLVSGRLAPRTGGRQG